MKNIVLPFDEDFKIEAKKLQSTENYKTLLAAQDALAVKYGFKDYKSIRNKILNPDSIKLNIFLFHTFYIEDKYKSQIEKTLTLFKYIFQKLNIVCFCMNNGAIKENKFNYHYSKPKKSCEVFITSYEDFTNFLTNEEILFIRKIKSNISKMFVEDKIVLLETLNSIQVNYDDSLLRFKTILINHLTHELESKIYIQRSLNYDLNNLNIKNELNNFIKLINILHSIDNFSSDSFGKLIEQYLTQDYKTLKELLKDSSITELKKDFAYQTKYGTFLILNISKMNSINFNELLKQFCESDDIETNQLMNFELEKVQYSKIIQQKFLIISMKESLELETIDKLYRYLHYKVNLEINSFKKLLKMNYKIKD